MKVSRLLFVSDYYEIMSCSGSPTKTLDPFFLASSLKSCAPALFTTETGAPFSFFVFDDVTSKKRLKKIIMSHGGTVCQDIVETFSIILVKESTKPPAFWGPCYSINFIFDCVKAFNVLELGDYLIEGCISPQSETSLTAGVFYEKIDFRPTCLPVTYFSQNYDLPDVLIRCNDRVENSSEANDNRHDLNQANAGFCEAAICGTSNSKPVSSFNSCAEVAITSDPNVISKDKSPEGASSSSNCVTSSVNKNIVDQQPPEGIKKCLVSKPSCCLDTHSSDKCMDQSKTVSEINCASLLGVQHSSSDKEKIVTCVVAPLFPVCKDVSSENSNQVISSLLHKENEVSRKEKPLPDEGLLNKSYSSSEPIVTSDDSDDDNPLLAPINVIKKKQIVDRAISRNKASTTTSRSDIRETESSAQKRIEKQWLQHRGDSDDDISELKNFGQVHPSFDTSKHSKLRFSRKEKSNILRFIIAKKAYYRLKSNTLYKEMEERNICPRRTYQSMKNHFLKTMLYELDTFEFLSESTKNKLRGEF